MTSESTVSVCWQGVWRGKYPRRERAWLLLLIGGLVLVGCRGPTDIEDKVTDTLSVSELERVEEHSVFPIEYRERARAALDELKTKELDTEPMFVYARLSRPGEPNEWCLTFMCFDEARDLRGIRVMERRQDPNGVVSLVEEDYPIFVDSLESWKVERRVIPIDVCDAGQRKNEELWLEYENRCLNALIEEVIAQKRGQSTGRTPAGRITLEDMPPLYVSLPDPPRVAVQVRAFDRTGHESEWIDIDISR